MAARADGQISAIIVAPGGPGPPGAAPENNLERALAYVLVLVPRKFVRISCSGPGPPVAALKNNLEQALAFVPVLVLRKSIRI